MPGRLAHLTLRFVQTVWVRGEPGNLGLVCAYLSSSEQALFARQRGADQRHAINLAERLRADGHDDPDLLRAALLHDVGKATGPLPLAHRVVYSFCANFQPGLARWLGAAPNPSWRRPFYLARHHAEIGAEAARSAGSNPRVVALIAGHEGPGQDESSRLLYDYDRHAPGGMMARGDWGKDPPWRD